LNKNVFQAIPHCDASVMAYVVQQLNGKFIVSKHESPLEALTQHFVPTNYTKYKSYILKDSAETKRLFNAMFNRIRQIFRYDAIRDLKTGETKYRSGIQIAYFDAKQKNLKIVTTGSSANNDIESSLSSSKTSNDIESIAHSISMDQPSYDPKFINMLTIQSTAKQANVIKILNALHLLQYHDIIREICESIFNRIDDLNKNEICTDKFYTLVQSKIISSKHNPDVVRIKDLSDKLLIDILKTVASVVDYNSFKPTTKAKLRSVVILGICYNVQKFKCK
jgi:hypothetical protein